MFSKLSHITNFPYTPAGRLCSKLQDFTGTGNVYAYSPNSKQHAVRRIYDPTTTNLRQMLWDANGNIAQIAEYLYDATNQQTFLQDFRNHYWDEDDRLNLVLDNSHFSYYLYGNDGQRVSKLTGSAFSLGTGFATNALLDNYTLYPSEYLVITQQGYTKYYYANVTRIASRLGSGGFEKMTRLCTLDLNITANANMLFNSVVARIGEDVPQEFISDPCPAYNSDMAGFRVPLQPLNFEANFGITAQQNILQAFRQNYANEETYFFHGNHLGSANWVTLQNASPTQFLLHLPYGEEFVKQLNSTYDERFAFTGKEKDIETGYYYFGARFDNVDLGFMSVDPMSEKYPSISPYAYCAWNPVKLVDPEGEKPRLPFVLRVLTSKNVYQAIKYKIKNGGELNIWENNSGCIFASVQSNKLLVDESGAIVIKAKAFRPEGYTNEAQLKATTDLFVRAEAWMDEPATSVGDFILKSLSSMGYSVFNEPVKLFTGCSLAGTEATSMELSEAFIGTAASYLGGILSKGMKTIKTVGKTGLGKYNDFVHKMGNYQGKTKKEMGRLYQNNEELNSAVSTYDKFEKGIGGTSAFRKDE